MLNLSREQIEKQIEDWQQQALKLQQEAARLSQQSQQLIGAASAWELLLKDEPAPAEPDLSPLSDLEKREIEMGASLDGA